MCSASYSYILNHNAGYVQQLSMYYEAIYVHSCNKGTYVATICTQSMRELRGFFLDHHPNLMNRK